MSEKGGALYHNHFAKREFWKERYASNKHFFEWYHPYKMIRDVMTQYVQDLSKAKLLTVGCGISKLPEDLYNDGFRNIVNIDISEDCVTKMRSHFNEKMPKTFLFLKMDATDMDFTDGVFTHVLDKGLLDSIMSGYRSTENVRKYLSEVFRVLDKNGKYFCLSYRPPDDRMQFIQSFGWEVSVHKIYRPVYQTELKWIKEEFFSKAVIEDIEKQRDVDIPQAFLEEKYTDDQDLTIARELLDHDKKEKERLIEEKNALKPRDVLSFYFYICRKGREEKRQSTVEEIPTFNIDEGALDSPLLPKRHQQQNSSPAGSEEPREEEQQVESNSIQDGGSNSLMEDN